MGCASSSKASSRETKFYSKAQPLFVRYQDLKKNVVEIRNLIYSKFSILGKTEPLQRNLDSCSIPKYLSNKNPPFEHPEKEDQITLENNDSNLDDSQNHVEKIENLKVEEKQVEQNCNFNQRNTPNASEEFQFIEKKKEMEYLKGLFYSYLSRNKNAQKLMDMCKSFQEKLTCLINQMVELQKESEVLNKCIKVYKEELTTKSSVVLSIEIDRTSTQLKLYLEQLQQTKTNLSELSLMTLVLKTSNSLLNSIEKETIQ